MISRWRINARRHVTPIGLARSSFGLSKVRLPGAAHKRQVPVCHDITALPELASAPLDGSLTVPWAEDECPRQRQSLRGWFTERVQASFQGGTPEENSQTGRGGYDLSGQDPEKALP